MTATITIEVYLHDVPPPEHADKSPCLCDDCWAEWVDWRAANVQDRE